MVGLGVYTLITGVVSKISPLTIVNSRVSSLSFPSEGLEITRLLVATFKFI